MTGVDFLWHTQYKDIVEREIDFIRVRILRGAALVTQGNTYWQLLVIHPAYKGVLQVGLLDVNGTLGVYAVPDGRIPPTMRQGRVEPDMSLISTPLECTVDTLRDTLQRALKGLR